MIRVVRIFVLFKKGDVFLKILKSLLFFPTVVASCEIRLVNAELIVMML